ncbi:hypothetical protein COC59_06345 [Bacillus cereus]|nr:hypothetical protein COC59_06345 [Bacillus cereus]
MFEGISLIGGSNFLTIVAEVGTSGLASPIVIPLDAVVHGGFVWDKSIQNTRDTIQKIQPSGGGKGTGNAQTGGRELSIDEYLKQLDQADEMYESFRKSKTDVQSIAKNTGITEQRVQRIKDHLFIKEHTKEHGVGRFDPDYEIVQAWDRLQKGTYNKNDIDLLNHELFESKFEGIFKADYRTANDKTVESGRPWYPQEEE